MGKITLENEQQHQLSDGIALPAESLVPAPPQTGRPPHSHKTLCGAVESSSYCRVGVKGMPDLRYVEVKNQWGALGGARLRYPADKKHMLISHATSCCYKLRNFTLPIGCLKELVISIALCKVLVD